MSIGTADLLQYTWQHFAGDSNDDDFLDNSNKLRKLVKKKEEEEEENTQRFIAGKTIDAGHKKRKGDGMMMVSSCRVNTFRPSCLWRSLIISWI